MKDSNGVIDAFLTKLSETHAIVPREPTVEMISAVTLPSGPLDEVLAARRHAAELYRAMIQAASAGDGESEHHQSDNPSDR